MNKNLKSILAVAFILFCIEKGALAQTTTLQVEVMDFGSNNRSKIIKLEQQKKQIQDYVSILKKGMSKQQKEQLTDDLKALRKCNFQKPCKEEKTNRDVSF